MEASEDIIAAVLLIEPTYNSVLHGRVIEFHEN